MKTKYLTIPNTRENLTKVQNTVAWHTINNCLTKSEVELLAAQYLMETYEEAEHSIGQLANMVLETPADANCRIPQPQSALYYGTVSQEGVLHPKDEYFFFVRERSPEYNSLEVKEEVR